MGYLDPLVLPQDVRVAPLATFPASYLAEIGAGADDYVVTRPRSRQPSTVIDARAAALLERFREPKTIVDAVVELSLAEHLDPRAILDDAAKLVRRFADEGVLAPASSPLAEPISAQLRPGDRLGDLRLLAPVQVLVDVEVHRGRAADGTPVAVKLARRAARAVTCAALLHEARVLDRLDGDGAPALVAQGELHGRPWIATRWCTGVDAATAAASLRSDESTSATGRLLNLADAVLQAYCHLHARGVVHGDVHPRNVVVDTDSAVRVLDFGAAALDGVGAEDAAGTRPGIDLYAEPELAEAALAGEPLPPPTAAGEQYAVGVLLFVLLVGDHPYGYTAQPGELLRRIVQPSPSFDDRWAGPAEVQTVIRRALQLRPEGRYTSIATMLEAFRAAVAAQPPGAARRAAGARPEPPRRDRLLADILDRLAPRGSRFEPQLVVDPTVMHGLAGRAWAVLRCAQSLDDPELLAVADLWVTEAARGAADAPGPASLLHGAAGVHVVRLAVAQARADEVEQSAAIAAFLDAASGPWAGADVTHGRAGLLLGCASLVAAASPTQRRLLIGLGSRLADGLDTEADDSSGVAHGTAGRSLALLRWAEVTGTPPSRGLTARLEALAEAVTGPDGTVRGAGGHSGHPLAASWCNGAAGLVHLWLAAYRVLGDDRWNRLADNAGRAVEHVATTASGDLCCGLGGQAYALLALHRASGEARWLASSRRLADGAAALVVRVRPDVRDSLYAGQPGVAALAADLAHPADARMPLVGH